MKRIKVGDPVLAQDRSGDWIPAGTVLKIERGCIYTAAGVFDKSALRSAK